MRLEVGGADGGVWIRYVVLEMIRIWKCALDARYDDEGVIYSAEVGLCSGYSTLEWIERA